MPGAPGGMKGRKVYPRVTSFGPITVASLQGISAQRKCLQVRKKSEILELFAILPSGAIPATLETCAGPGPWQRAGLPQGGGAWASRC